MRSAILGLLWVTSGCGPVTIPDNASDALWAEITRLQEEGADLGLPEEPADGDYSGYPQDPLNPITPEKVALGRSLFFETGLSTALINPDGPQYTFSCATCHNPRASFASGSSIGHGIGEGGEGELSDRRITARYQGVPGGLDFSPWNEMRLLNAGYRDAISGWQGEFDCLQDNPGNAPDALLGLGFRGLESFVHTALTSHGLWGRGESAPSGGILRPRLGDRAYLAYLQMFRAAFPSEPEDAVISRRLAALAIAAYVRTVVPNSAPFQRFLRGDEAGMSESAIRGMTVILSQGCTDCHAGPGMTSNEFHPIDSPFDNPGDELPMSGQEYELRIGSLRSGVTVHAYLGSKLPEAVTSNLGRANVTDEPADSDKFTTPTLYGAGDPNTLRYGHGGYYTDLATIVSRMPGGSALSSSDLSDTVQALREALVDPDLQEKYGDDDGLSTAGFPTPVNP